MRLASTRCSTSPARSGFRTGASAAPVYLLHAHEVECIGKGKPRAPYEFGCKVSVATGVETRRIHVDKGYRGHNHPHMFRVWVSGQARRVTAVIRCEMKCRAAVEPTIGHLKAEHRMGRNYLKDRTGDRINVVLAAAGYNFSLLLRWLEALLCALIKMLDRAIRQAKSA